MAKVAKGHAPVRFDRFTERQFGPYVTAIGQLVLAWNSFHEIMAWTYEIVIADFIRKTDDNRGPQVREGWNSIGSDREKRKLLRAAAANLPDAAAKNLPKIRRRR